MKIPLSLGALAFYAMTAHAAGDAARGAQLFRQCAACHSTVQGEQLTGPSLAHVWNRKAGSAKGFSRYSDALTRSGLTWNAATLNKWLAAPQAFVPGSAMMFPGVREAQARQDLIAYLKALDENKAPASAQVGGGMMMGTPRRVDLKIAPAAGQVRSLRHCGDSYLVETADGRVEKVWEFNLRFKTDTSKFGPAPGKPVVTGAGMQGDRASVVFAAPTEISAFIKESCR